MKKNLHFNKDKAIADLKIKILKVADNLLEEYYAEVYDKLNTLSGKRALEKLTENQEDYFRRKVVGYADAIIDSYGTGSLMDTSSPYLSEYNTSDMQSKENVVKPCNPSYAFQHAQIWFFQGNRIKNVLDEVIKDYVFGMSKYFEFR